MKNRIIIGDLILKVYVVGFEPCGESVLFTINDDDKILFSGLTDCYANNKYSVLSLMNELNISNLDYFCISHPDYDHCCQISDIIPKFSEKTILAIPNNLLNYINEYEDNVKNGLLEIGSLLNSRKKKPVLITCTENKNIIDDILFTTRDGMEYKLEINSLSPISSIVEKYPIKDNQSIDYTRINNDFSVINAITLGNFKMLLLSDIQNNSLKQLKKIMNFKTREFFRKDINFLKIAHHSSRNSDFIFDILNGLNLEESVTTVYRSSSLPNQQIIDMYKNISDNVFSTGKVFKNDACKDEYGIVMTEYNITKETVHTELIESAVSL